MILTLLKELANTRALISNNDNIIQMNGIVLACKQDILSLCVKISVVQFSLLLVFILICNVNFYRKKSKKLTLQKQKKKILEKNSFEMISLNMSLVLK